MVVISTNRHSAQRAEMLTHHKLELLKRRMGLTKVR